MLLEDITALQRHREVLAAIKVVREHVGEVKAAAPAQVATPETIQQVTSYCATLDGYLEVLEQMTRRLL